jgi:hypothetical protein
MQPDAGGLKLLIGLFGVIGLVLIVGICNQSNSVDSFPTAHSDSSPGTSSPRQVPALSREDSARFRQRAREIAQENRPNGWAEAERSRMNYLADTVLFFGDTADKAVRTWIAAKRRADEERGRNEAEAAERRADAAKWSYYSTTDPMASRPSRTASIQSENTVNFDFPYQGPQHAILTLRNHPSYGRDVYQDRGGADPMSVL